MSMVAYRVSEDGHGGRQREVSVPRTKLPCFARNARNASCRAASEEIIRVNSTRQQRSNAATDKKSKSDAVRALPRAGCVQQEAVRSMCPCPVLPFLDERDVGEAGTSCLGPVRRLVPRWTREGQMRNVPCRTATRAAALGATGRTSAANLPPALARARARAWGAAPRVMGLMR